MMMVFVEDSFCLMAVVYNLYESNPYEVYVAGLTSKGSMMIPPPATS